MRRIYIIGSISQIDNYCEYKDCIKECFKNIQWCDELVVVAKIRRNCWRECRARGTVCQVFT